MDQIAGVGMGQALGRLADVVCRQFEAQGTFGFHELLQILAVHEFHDNEIAVHFIVDAIGLNDIRMVERGDRAGLGKETVQRGPVFGDGAGNDLQGHAAVHRHVLGEKDGTHASFAQPLDELVLAQAELCPLAQGQDRAGLPAADQVFASQGPGQGRGIGRFAGKTLSLHKLFGAEAACFFPRPTDIHQRC